MSPTFTQNYLVKRENWKRTYSCIQKNKMSNSKDDYIACKGEQGAKEAGKWRSEGKDYEVQDGDVVLFRFNV